MDEPLAPDDLADRLMEVFSRIGILYRHVYRKIEQETVPAGLSVGVRAICDLLDTQEPMTVPQMGRALALSRQFVQRMVNDALAAELVETFDNPRHQRSPLVGLTTKGSAAIATTTAREHAVLREVGGNLTGSDIDTCLEVLHHLGQPFADVDFDGRTG
ncbi:MarR family winged helix-turn-helix transcriptional regulator [Nocardia sp. NBC_01329]|uniref:MarR family winged helix-turn-helix transcriptional regulator n=1 Tax=Nocardia sp. NBC_01329 TaxID=2903594 RepID=UPI002E0D193F|nr:MarR family winged helix-turn-helix transcriptional regulator [Nocardia sp. NBC_01329]